MTTLVLNERQSDIVAGCNHLLEVRDSNGRLIGRLQKADSDEGPMELNEDTVRELIRRMSMKDIQWRTTADVVASLEALDRK